jgi:hypothetical protein
MIQFNRGSTRWLGDHLDRCMNWHAHVDICVPRALGKQQQVRRVMAAHGINRKLARTLSWSTWTDPLTGEFTRPSSIGQLLGNPRWEKRLLKFLQRTKIGRIGPDLIDDEIRRVTRYEGWTDLVPDERSIDRGEQVADHILDTIVVRQT